MNNNNSYTCWPFKTIDQFNKKSLLCNNLQAEFELWPNIHHEKLNALCLHRDSLVAQFSNPEKTSSFTLTDPNFLQRIASYIH